MRAPRARAGWGPTRRAACALLLAALATTVDSQAARAQQSPAGVEEPPEAYMALIEEAVAESVAEHWVEARSLFREAQRVYPNARALRGVGMTSFELRDYTAARRALLASLAEPRRALDPEQRAQVEALLRRVHGLIARYTVTHLGPGAVVTVDAVRQQLDTDGHVLMAAGPHEVGVQLSDGRHIRGSWTVRGGETGPLPLELPRADEAPPVEPQPPAPGPVAAATEPPPLASSGSSAGVGWGLVGGGAGLAVVGLTLAIMGRGDIALLEQPPPGTAWDDVATLQSRGPRFVRAGTALLLLGGASIATGAVWVVRARSATARAGVEARLLPNGGRLEVTW